MFSKKINLTKNQWIAIIAIIVPVALAIMFSEDKYSQNVTNSPHSEINQFNGPITMINKSIPEVVTPHTPFK